MSEPLRLREDGLKWSPADLTVPTVPMFAAGEDPMSTLIAEVAPGLATDLTSAVAATNANETAFSANISGARSAYQNTDATEQQRVQAAAERPAAAAGASSTSASGAGGAQSSQFGQLMSMAMQGASQAAQVPMQAAGMVASAPQSVMQGAQGAMQQIGQLSGQLDKSGGETEQGEPLDIPLEERERDDDDKADKEEQQPQGRAAAGAETSERAPDAQSHSPTTGPVPYTQAPEPHLPNDRLNTIDL